MSPNDKFIYLHRGIFAYWRGNKPQYYWDAIFRFGSKDICLFCAKNYYPTATVHTQLLANKYSCIHSNRYVDNCTHASISAVFVLHPVIALANCSTYTIVYCYQESADQIVYFIINGNRFQLNMASEILQNGNESSRNPLVSLASYAAL